MVTTIDHTIRKRLGITIPDYCLLTIIQAYSNNPATNGWCTQPRIEIAEVLDISTKTLNRMVAGLVKKDLLILSGTVLLPQYRLSPKAFKELSYMVTPEEVKPPLKMLPLEDRKKAFGKKVKEFIDKFSKQTLVEFYEYWTETSEGGQKMRFEKETVFDVKKRLERWKKRDLNKTEEQVAALPPSPFKNEGKEN